MKELGPYDSNLEMYVEPVRDPNFKTLEFLKWLIDNDRLDPKAEKRKEIMDIPIPPPYVIGQD